MTKILDKVKKIFIIWSNHCRPEPAINLNQQLVSGYLFDSFQLTVTWMSTIKLNTDCICLGHLASNARLLQENSQSEHAYYCSDIINTVEECICTVHVLCGL